MNIGDQAMIYANKCWYKNIIKKQISKLIKSPISITEKANLLMTFCYALSYQENIDIVFLEDIIKEMIEKDREEK